jgi:EpsG-like putative glucosyltransferase
LIYILIFAVLLLGGIISRRSRSLREVLYYICLLGLFIFSAFRYHVGCDWPGYLNIFKLSENKQITWQTREAGFWIANQLLHYYELDYPYINVIAATFFFIGLHALAKRQPDPYGFLTLSFPILILNIPMSAIRQGIAVGFFCIACNAFVNRRIIGFVFPVLTGALFHSSALFLLVLTPFVRGEYSIRRVALGGALALPGIYYFLTSNTVDSYSKLYVGTRIEAFGAAFRTGLLALTGIAFLFFLDGKWKKQSPLDYKLVKLCSYLMIFAFMLSIYSSVGGDRIAYYLVPIQLVILARLPFLISGALSAPVASLPYAALGLVLGMWIWSSSLFEGCYSTYQLWL